MPGLNCRRRQRLETLPGAIMHTGRAPTLSQRLRECEQPGDARGTRLSWVRLAYARIYRFLLSRYGDLSFRESSASNMPFVDAAESLVGKKARSSGEIQHALKEIHAAQPAGPFSDGSTVSSTSGWIAVASGNKRFPLPEAARLLREQQIPARVKKQGRVQTLQVPMERRGEAFALLQAMRVAPPQVANSEARVRTMCEWQQALVAFVIVGACATLGLVAIDTLPWQRYSAIFALLGVIVSLTVGLVCGAFTATGPRPRPRQPPSSLVRTRGQRRS